MTAIKALGKRIGFGTKAFNKRGFIFLSVFPGFAWYIIFILVPNALTAALSFHRWKGVTWEFRWMGLANYQRMFGDPIFYTSLKNNFYYALISMVLVIIIALFMATILSNKSIKRPGFFRAIFYFPNVMSVVVISLMWRFMYDPNLGIINGILREVGADGLTRVWLGNLSTVRPALIVPQVWSGVGLYILIYMTTIRSINPALYEAAAIDGAGKIRQFFTITLPLIIPTIKTTMILFLAGALSGGFALVRIMTQGGPNNASNVLANYLYDKAFRDSDYGYAAAIGVFILVMGFAMYYIIMKVFKSETYET